MATKRRSSDSSDGMSVSKKSCDSLDIYKTEVEYDANDKLICIFKNREETRAMTWVEKMIHNLAKGKNITVVNCQTEFNQNQLETALGFLETCNNFSRWESRLYPKIDDKITIETPKAPRVVYNVGYHVKGGAIPFYFFDTVKMKRYKSTFGEFFILRWSNINRHNMIYSNIMSQYFKEDQIKLQDCSIINAPDENNPGKISFVRKFYDIKQHSNETVYSTGDLVKSVVCEPFTVERYNDLFAFQQEGGEQAQPSQEVDLYMGAIIEGFKQSKNETTLESVNNKKYQEKTYSLAIKPMIFFNIEQTD
ncbi:dbp [Cryptophlebia peltastica nucleopolyhedrovirus]|uniref:Dbp n=1 Tax=Cryptophlebia peltastica nucleopolyhedrovirus TaxID=2304025 RepID=A0A346RNN0_9ABAC|nr:dbp [Cryptophlebia peltastica nucleopolyhedrovirus]AXS67677.1 dbp [Cryptophlebia peltastica nucleopolyhedrovirus]RTL85959.1 hypothetical protein EJV44_24795 [Ancylobacter aquaticus]